MIDALASDSTLKFVSVAKSLAKEIKANLGLGEPDKYPPKGLVEELIRETKVKPTYTPSSGIRELREALANWLNERYGTDVRPEEVMITPSGKAALYLAFLYMSKKVKSALLFDPFYYSYPPVLKSLSIKIRSIPLEKGTVGYDFPKGIEDLVAEKELVVLNTPSNPTGSVLGQKMYTLMKALEEKDSYVISDEVYDVFVYEGEHVSLIQTKGWRERGIMVYSFSKVLCVPGWRLGAIVASEEVIKTLTTVASNIYGCPCNWEQRAVAKFLSNHREELEEHIKSMVKEYSERRDVVIGLLREVGAFPGVGAGAFYAFPSFGVDSETLSLEAAKRGVIAIPGTIFSEVYGKDSVRISFSAPLEEVEYGIKVLGELAASIRG